MGAVQPSIKVSQLIYVEYLLTKNIEEQTLIGNFFKNLDDKIEQSSQRIKKIENFKSAMMEKMFI